jgi:hypothetical protein
MVQFLKDAYCVWPIAQMATVIHALVIHVLVVSTFTDYLLTKKL